MIEDYIQFSDDDDLIGVWYCGTIEHHFWCVVTRKGANAHIYFRMETTHTKKGFEAAQRDVLSKLNAHTIPMSELGRTDEEANDSFHELLYIIAPTFMEQDRPRTGGIFFIRPCKGSVAKDKIAKADWPRLLGVDGKGAC